MAIVVNNMPPNLVPLMEKPATTAISSCISPNYADLRVSVKPYAKSNKKPRTTRETRHWYNRSNCDWHRSAWNQHFHKQCKQYLRTDPTFEEYRLNKPNEMNTFLKSFMKLGMNNMSSINCKYYVIFLSKLLLLIYCNIKVWIWFNVLLWKWGIQDL